jgi:hypothetical protein
MVGVMVMVEAALLPPWRDWEPRLLTWLDIWASCAGRVFAASHPKVEVQKRG